MISGILMFLISTRNKIIKICSILALIIYAVFTNSFTLFGFINMTLVVAIPLLLSVAHNKWVSAMSMLIYSVCIDIICYFMFQSYIYTDIISHIILGLEFNFKSVLIPIILCVVSTITERGFKNESKIISTRQ